MPNVAPRVACVNPAGTDSEGRLTAIERPISGEFQVCSGVQNCDGPDGGGLEGSEGENGGRQGSVRARGYPPPSAPRFVGAIPPPQGERETACNGNELVLPAVTLSHWWERVARAKLRAGEGPPARRAPRAVWRFDSGLAEPVRGHRRNTRMRTGHPALARRPVFRSASPRRLSAEPARPNSPAEAPTPRLSTSTPRGPPRATRRGFRPAG